MGEVTNIAFKMQDNRRWTVEQALEQALADVRSGKIDVNKCLLVVLHDREDEYHCGWYAANMRVSEQITLTHVLLTEFTDDLRGISIVHDD